jgi:hypothetical protein
MSSTNGGNDRALAREWARSRMVSELIEGVASMGDRNAPDKETVPSPAAAHLPACAAEIVAQLAETEEEELEGGEEDGGGREREDGLRCHRSVRKPAPDKSHRLVVSHTRVTSNDGGRSRVPRYQRTSEFRGSDNDDDIICSCRNKNQPKAIYPKGTSHHTRLFRGPSTNGMKK